MAAKNLARSKKTSTLRPVAPPPESDRRIKTAGRIAPPVVDNHPDPAPGEAYDQVSVQIDDARALLSFLDVDHNVVELFAAIEELAEEANAWIAIGKGGIHGAELERFDTVEEPRNRALEALAALRASVKQARTDLSTAVADGRRQVAP